MVVMLLTQQSTAPISTPRHGDRGPTPYDSCRLSVKNVATTTVPHSAAGHAADDIA
jgi:hypothetical protein